MSETTDTDHDPEEAENYDAMLALGRVLAYELRGTGLQPTFHTYEAGLFDANTHVETTLRLENSHHHRPTKITPDAMAVLADFDLSVMPIIETMSDTESRPTWRLGIPDAVEDAYAAAVEELGEPPAPPREWDEQWPWTHQNVMESYDPMGETEVRD